MGSVYQKTKEKKAKDKVYNNKTADDMLGSLMDAVAEGKITSQKASDLLQYASKDLSATEGSFKKGGLVCRGNGKALKVKKTKLY
jgi:Asp-tRNA(Asn)/Glu-tRNA(Gln) amidotransferase B subunit